MDPRLKFSAVMKNWTQKNYWVIGEMIAIDLNFDRVRMGSPEFLESAIRIQAQFVPASHQKSIEKLSTIDVLGRLKFWAENTKAPAGAVPFTTMDETRAFCEEVREEQMTQEQRIQLLERQVSLLSRIQLAHYEAVRLGDTWKQSYLLKCAEFNLDVLKEEPRVGKPIVNPAKVQH